MKNKMDEQTNTNLIRCVSYNCKSFKARKKELYDLCSTNDIILIQEHWLLSTELDLLKTFHTNFDCHSVSAVDPSKGLFLGRPYGGVAIMYRKSLYNVVSQIDFKDPRLIGIVLSSGTCKTLFINVYLPYEKEENFAEYVEYLGKIQTIVDEHESNHVVVVGDFNAHPGKPFGNEMLGFSYESDFHVSDIEELGIDSNTFTYLSDAHGTTSWLDHIVSTNSAHVNISDISVLYDIIGSDHLPLAFNYKFKGAVLPDTPKSTNYRKSVKWDKMTREALESYTNMTSILLDKVHVNLSLLRCTNINCKDLGHRAALDDLYNDIIASLCYASDTCLAKYTTHVFNPVPGWNDHVSDLHSIAREAFITWRANGKPRTGPLHDSMKISRARFKWALKKCKTNREQMCADAMAKSYGDKNYREFWKKIKKTNSSKAAQSDDIEGAHGEDEIKTLWANHFEDLFNCVRDTKHKSFVDNSLFEENLKEQFLFYDVSQTSDMINRLPNGKSEGHDGLSAEHIKLSSPKLSVLLTVLINAMILHGHVPDSLIKVILVPIVKNKAGDITSKNNYRPIALAAVLSKLVELVMIERCKESIESSDHQFAYKSGHATDTCIFVFKQVVDYYIRNGSPAFVCFLDASKAFDRVNHWTLYRKLIERKTPLHIVRLLVKWYDNQKFVVRWGNSFSHEFAVTNGVRQGGIMSPLLYNVYTDDLNRKLSQMNVGCSINGMRVNCLSYADDMVLISPSASGLQNLIDTCCKYATEHDILYNAKKSVCMIVYPKSRKIYKKAEILLEDRTLTYVNNVSYLGHVISSSLSDVDDIKRQYRSLCIRANSLSRRFSICSLDVKYQLFQSYCISMYCATLWSNYTVKSMQSLRVCYNNALRMLLGKPRHCSASEMFVNAGLLSFNEYMRKSIYSFKQRIITSENKIVKCIVASGVFESSLNARWNSQLL